MPHEQLAAALGKSGPSWISFAITFFLVSVFWVDQHRVFHALSKVFKETLVLTFLFLARVSVLPFSTSFWGHNLKDSLATSIYFGNPLAIALALTTQVEIATRGKQILPNTDLGAIRFRLGSMRLVLASAVVSALYLELSYVWVAPITLMVAARVTKLLWRRRRGTR